MESIREEGKEGKEVSLVASCDSGALGSRQQVSFLGSVRDFLSDLGLDNSKSFSSPSP